MLTYHMKTSNILLSSHGNSKVAKPFHPTWPSTLARIKEEASTKGPKSVMNHVSSEVGGVESAVAPGQLPRNELQVLNQKRKLKAGARVSSSNNASDDDLFAVMQEAHTQDPCHMFVRDIKTAPEPAIVLATDQQLADLVRFATSSGKFCIVTIDPTFSLGEFDVTPLTYRHLLLTTKRYNQPPIFLGPILIHYRKTFATYLFFASSLIGQCPQLEGVRAFGTDGETALIKAFSHEFGFFQHIHVRRNIKDKLNECHVPSPAAQQILDDIFGKRIDSVFQEGLVDSTDNTFQDKLEYLLAKWSTIECTSATDMDGFIQWFRNNKVGVISSTMLRTVREDCGLGNPPDIFTTNPSESINAVLKKKMDYKKKELPELVEKLKELILEQNKEVERAVVCRGKYRFKTEYQFLEVPESKWFSMSVSQRRSHLSKVHSLAIAKFPESSSAHGISDEDDDATVIQLSVEVESAAKELHIPLTCVQNIWRKASELLNKKCAIVTAPGPSDDNAKMVLSFSGKTPHLVTATKREYACDNNCPNWKSIGFCSHTVAIAQVKFSLSPL